MSMKRYFRGIITPQWWLLVAAVAVAFVHVGGPAKVTGLARAQMHFAAEAPPPPAPKPRPKPVPPPINCHRVRCIALTFDDGPNPITTPQILTILEHEHVKATFFVVGSRVKGNEATLRRMHKDGDEIGNHTWSHPDLALLTPKQIKQQIAATQRIVRQAGVPTPTLFRPPYGDIDAKVKASIPMTFMFWNEDPRDWAADTPKQVETAVLASAKPGGIVDMHDIYHVTAKALDPTIKKLKSQHFHFVTVSELLDIKPGQRGDFYGRP